MGIIIDGGGDKGETEREGGTRADQSGDNMMITFLWFPSKSKRHGWTYKKEAKEKKGLMIGTGGFNENRT